MYVCQVESNDLLAILTRAFAAALAAKTLWTGVLSQTPTSGSSRTKARSRACDADEEAHAGGLGRLLFLVVDVDFLTVIRHYYWHLISPSVCSRVLPTI